MASWTHYHKCYTNWTTIIYSFLYRLGSGAGYYQLGRNLVCMLETFHVQNVAILSKLNISATIEIVIVELSVLILLW